MTDRTAAENFVLDMLGDHLADAVRHARDRLDDETIMARVGGTDRETPQPGLVHVERGNPAEVLNAGMTPDEATAYLAGLS